MLNIKHILFPMDFSDRCKAAVPFVRNMAASMHAKVTLLSVLEPLYYGGLGDPAHVMLIDTDDLLADLNARLDQAIAKDFDGVEAGKFAAMGDPARVILDFARDNRVDLIMMPNHGYGPFRRLLLGSVTAAVLHDAECPVWTGAHIEDRQPPEHVQPRTILCAIDGSAKSVPLLKWATELSKATGTSLRLVHILDRASETPEEALRKIERREAEAGISVPACVTKGEVQEGVREEAVRHDADLLVIGRGVLQDSLGRLRTHVYAIVQNAPCPVVSI